MNNHTMAVFSCLSVLIALTACSTQFKYQEEPKIYSANRDKVAISYLELAFPVNKSQQRALQLALVKHKKQAASQERWLLLHQVPYQWVWVEWKEEQFHLLAAGPFKSAHQLMSQRRIIQEGMDVLNSMPAIALLESSSNAGLASGILAEVSPGSESMSEIKSEGYSH